jgi:chromosome segregation ATPase
MASETADLTTTILREIQRDLREQRDLLVMMTQHVLRLDRRMGDLERRMGDLERRMSELPADIETMLKMELIGHRVLIEDGVEGRLHELADRIKALEEPR